MCGSPVVQLRSFYEDNTGHKLVVESGSLPMPAYSLSGSPRTGCWYHVLRIPSSSCAKREIDPSKREAFFFKLGKHAGLGVGIVFESFLAQRCT